MLALTQSNILDSLARSFALVRDGPALVELGQPVTARVLPPAADLSVPAVLTLGSGVNAAQLPVQLPVAVTVGWQVLKPTPTGDLVELSEAEVSSDLPPGGAQGAIASFVLGPAAVVELTADAPLPPPERRVIRATVTLSVTLEPPAAGQPATVVTGQTVTLPDVSVFVPVLAVPTVLALFRHPHFAPVSVAGGPGAVVIVVPASSPLRHIAQVQLAVQALTAAVGGLVRLPSMPLFLLGLTDLSLALPVQPKAAFVVADSIADLSKIELFDIETPYRVGATTIGTDDVIGIPIGDLSIPGTDSGTANVNAMDEMSSLILLGPPPRRDEPGAHHPSPGGASAFTRTRVARCFNDFALKSDLGQLTVSIGAELCAIVADLSFDARESGVVDGASVPSGLVTVDRPSTQTSFDNVISSVAIGWRLEPVSPGEPTHGVTPSRSRRTAPTS